MAKAIADSHIRTIRDREHDADDIIREVLGAVRQTFLTPFDRGAITALIGAMDDVIDEIQAAASAIELYEVTDFTPHQQQMADDGAQGHRAHRRRPCRCCATSSATGTACTS